MIEILFRECCENCTHIQVDHETYGTGITVPNTMIGCVHMSVCGRYRREEPIEEAPQEVTVKGFHDADG